MGIWGGSWEQTDYEDENLITNFNLDFPVELDYMKNHLFDIYNQLCKNDELNSDLYDPKWVKKLRKYNNLKLFMTLLTNLFELFELLYIEINLKIGFFVF